MWAGDPRETPMALRKPKYRYRNLPVSRAALAVIMLPVEILREILAYVEANRLGFDPGSAFERSHTKPFTKVNCSYSQAGVKTYEHLPYPVVDILFIPSPCTGARG